MLLEEMTWSEVEDAIAAGTPVVLPTGSIEQHGHHLPLTTDSITALGISRMLAERRPLVVAPAIHYTPHSRPSVGGGGKGFKGSLGIPVNVMDAFARAVVHDLLRQGFRRIIVVNGHFENLVPFIEALDAAVDECEDARAIFMTWTDVLTEADLEAAGFSGFRGWDFEHAATTETSFVACLRPDLVRHEHKSRGGVDRRATYEVFPLPRDLVPASGMIGDATTANADLGRRWLDIIVERMDDVITREFAEQGAQHV